MIKVVTRVMASGATRNPITDEIAPTHVRVYVDVFDGDVVLSTTRVFQGTMRELGRLGIKFGDHSEEGVRL